MTTSTAVRYFIAVNADKANQITIDGLGHSAAEAIEDAVRSAGLSSNKRIDDLGEVRDADGDIITEVFVAQECTSALYKLVQEYGGSNLRWMTNDDGLQDLVND